MTPNDLLMDDDRAKWYIIQYLGLKRSSFISMDILCEFFQLSKYKVERYLDELITDTIELTGKQVIFLLPTGEIRCDELTPLLVKRFAGQFFLRSDVFKIFHRSLVKEDRIDNQMADFAMSRSLAFKIRRRIKQDMKDEGFDFRKNQFLGKEFRLRSFIFGLYYESFNGIVDPFPVDIQIVGKKLQQQLIQSFGFSIKKTQELKLNFFLAIWLIRIKNKHLLEEHYAVQEEDHHTALLGKTLSRFAKVEAELLKPEIDYLFLFLELEGILPKGRMRYLASEEAEKAHYLTEGFLDYFADFFGSAIDELRENERAKADLLTIHQRLLFYHFREVTFINDTQAKFFEEVNPVIDHHINSFLQRVELLDVFLSKEERNKLYYDYLFFLLFWIPAEKFEVPLYVCIDFSHGSYYNNYVQEMLNSMQSMNVCFEEKLSTKTHVYLTDFAMEKLPCQQVIWKRPPTPDDWRELGDVLIKMKEEKINEETSSERYTAIVPDEFTAGAPFDQSSYLVQGNGG